MGKVGRPPGPAPRGQSYTRNLAAVIREHIDPVVYIDFLTSVLEGKSPVFVRDEETGEFSVEHEIEFTPPTHEQKMRALETLLARGYGQPVQINVLDGILRDENSGERFQLSGVSASTLHSMRELLTLPAPASAGDASPGVSHGAGNADADAVDAEFTESTSTDDVDQHDPP